VTAVVFDIDDTLYLERDYVRSGFAAAGDWAKGELGVDDLADRAWAAFLDGERRTIFDTVLAAATGAPADPAVVADLVAAYREHTPAIALSADAGPCLDAVAAAGPVGVVSDGPLASQRAKAGALGLDRWAAVVVLTAERGPGWGKPDPRPFALVQQRLGAAAGDCVYVADNPAKDFAGPRRLGWTTVRVRRPLGLHRDRPAGADVDHEIADLSGLAAVLAR
jgi:putative hydrolase of the HAD superfamily